MRCSSAVSALLLSCLLLAATRPAQGQNVIDTVVGGVTNAWDTVKDTVTGLYTSAECSVVKWADVDLTSCTAPTLNGTVQCTDQCKENLDTVAGASRQCIEKLVSGIASKGNAATTAQWESQLTACGIQYTKPTNGALGAYGSVALPLLVMAASMALTQLLSP